MSLGVFHSNALLDSGAVRLRGHLFYRQSCRLYMNKCINFNFGMGATSMEYIEDSWDHKSKMATS